jgi:hypothetical protein
MIRVSGLPSTPKCFVTCPLSSREFTMPDKADKEARNLKEGNGNKLIEISPLKLLAVILKAVLTDRITDEEIEKICSVYYKTIQEWWE